ncbi:MAG: glycoside hydrolase family 31 protein [Anaerolineae bacterium]|nr:glycoside hydrolase family 31 protein [Anaerolineae bacterium]
MGQFAREGNVLVWQENQHKVWIQPWGHNGLRVQANLAGKRLDLPHALLEAKAAADSDVAITIGDNEASIRCGALQARISRRGWILYSNTLSGQIYLQEKEVSAYHMPPSRHFKPRDGRLFQIEAWFEAQEGERLYGLGQHQHGRLDQKGCVIELHQRNTEVAIPFLVSSRKYGFLWNNPSIGRVELGCNATRWVAEGSQQLDYYVVCGDTYAEILEHYAGVTGHTPSLPEWASGFWQSRLRYETQEELLQVAREYKQRGLPLSVIVSDFFNWSHMGDWRFDPHCWPDPAAMVDELKKMGVRLMVSIWPTVIPLSENYETMRDRGLLVNNEYGVDAQQVFVDHDVNGPAYFAYYDATNPEARRFIWDTIKQNYYAQGVKLWWLDNDEPDINPWTPQNLRFLLGNGVEVANIYPLLHQMGFFEGMREEGETEIVLLSRSAWAGSQRFASLIWSGDIASTFEALQAQVRAGLNMAMSGIPWWTTDIGGFHGGDIRTPYFRELILRWFQYGVFCPIFRLHGHRLPMSAPPPTSGADNEVWSFGDEAYEIIRDLLFLRERLRPYIHTQMQVASEQGLPPMRPLFVDFPNNPICETIDDQFMFGPEILVAPVLSQGIRERSIYLPGETDWIDAKAGTEYDGGQWTIIPAPLDTIPVFLKAGSDLYEIFQGR